MPLFPEESDSLRDLVWKPSVAGFIIIAVMLVFGVNWLTGFVSDVIDFVNDFNFTGLFREAYRGLTDIVPDTVPVSVGDKSVEVPAPGNPVLRETFDTLVYPTLGTIGYILASPVTIALLVSLLIVIYYMETRR